MLVRDEDFEYKNGRLWLSRRVLKDHSWQGIISRGDRIYCQNMHIVGRKEPTTWTNQTVLLPVLKVDKTTFVENFLHNSAFFNSPIIVNKPLFSQEKIPDQEQWLHLKKASDQWLERWNGTQEEDHKE